MPRLLLILASIGTLYAALQALVRLASGTPEHDGSEPFAGRGKVVRSSMTPAQARAVLGVEEGASHEAILIAHRRLMQKLHPDAGGTAFLSAQVNCARDVLLASQSTS